MGCCTRTKQRRRSGTSSWRTNLHRRMNKEACYLTDLPWELIEAMAPYLGGPAVDALARTCRHFAALLDDRRTWRRVCQQEMPHVLWNALNEWGSDADNRATAEKHRRLCARLASHGLLRYMRAAEFHRKDDVDWRAQCLIRHPPAQRIGFHDRYPRAHLNAHPRDATIYPSAVSICRPYMGKHAIAHPRIADLLCTAGDDVGNDALVVHVHHGSRATAKRKRFSATYEQRSRTRPHHPVPKKARLGSPVAEYGEHVWPNGDVCAYTYEIVGTDPQRQRMLWFRTSPNCPDRRFANLLFYDIEWVDLHPTKAGIALPISSTSRAPTVGIFFPAPHQAEFDVFREYVLSGLVGWDDAHVRAFIRHVDGAWLLADAPLVRTQDPMPAVRAIDGVFAPDLEDHERWSISWLCSTPKERALESITRPPFRLARRLSRRMNDISEWRHQLCALSNGAIYAMAPLCHWFAFLEKRSRPIIDPLTSERVAPFIVCVMSQWPRDLVKRTAIDAFCRVWTLIADGADRLAEWPEVDAQSLQRATILRAYHVQDGGTSNPKWSHHNRSAACALSKGLVSNGCVPLSERHLQCAADGHAFEFVHVHDIVVPPTQRVLATLSERALASKVADVTFLGCRMERVTWTAYTFKRCHFGEAALVECAFIDCAFVDCSFGDATLERCTFVRSTFGTRRGLKHLHAYDEPITNTLARMGCRNILDLTQS